jgi:hypothetical protein
MRRQHRGGCVKTLNTKHYRLLIHRPGQPVKVHTDASMKVLRPLLAEALAGGARVEKQKHIGFDAYATIAVYGPAAGAAGGAL